MIIWSYDHKIIWPRIIGHYGPFAILAQAIYFAHSFVQISLFFPTLSGPQDHSSPPFGKEVTLNIPVEVTERVDSRSE